MWSSGGVNRQDRMGEGRHYPGGVLARGVSPMPAMSHGAVHASGSAGSAAFKQGDLRDQWVAVGLMQQSTTMLHVYDHTGGAAAATPDGQLRPGLRSPRHSDDGVLQFCHQSRPGATAAPCALSLMPVVAVDCAHPVVAFLEKAGLGQYAHALLQSGFDDMETLMAIEDADMKDLGIPRGHVVKMRRKLREYSEREGVDGGEEEEGERGDEEGAGPEAHHPLCAEATRLRLPEQARLLSLPPAARLPEQAPEVARRGLPTKKMKSSVEESWEQLQRMGIEEVGQLLFQDFFEHVPETQELFPPEVRLKYQEWSTDDTVEGMKLHESPALKKLWAKVVNAIGFSVSGLHDLEKLVPKLRDLGARHMSYRATEAHFALMGKCLIRTLRHCLGQLFTPEVEFAWTMVYGFISAIMVSGLQAARQEAAVQAEPVSSMPTGRSDTEEPELRADGGDEEQEDNVAGGRQLVAEGRDVYGGFQVYRVVRHLQKAIFGDVFEAVGLSTGQRFAIKVLDQDIVARFHQLRNEDHQFCESPLNEVRFAEMMRGLPQVAQLEDHFADECSQFVVSELAEGGDLLEALRLRPTGFSEAEAQLLLRDAAKGLASLHQRCLAMQDVSLENMLLYFLEDGQWQVRLCDPGQAVTFSVDLVTGLEGPVDFHGFVAKEYRPPELYAKQPYMATKVDSWCLGWSTFYLLCAQPLFHSADPEVDDPDWELFEQKSFPKLFRRRGWRSCLSPHAQDFILRLMAINPRQRMSVKDALRHPWLAGDPAPSPSVVPRSQAAAEARARVGAGATEAQKTTSARPMLEQPSTSTLCPDSDEVASSVPSRTQSRTAATPPCAGSSLSSLNSAPAVAAPAVSAARAAAAALEARQPRPTLLQRPPAAAGSVPVSAKEARAPVPLPPGPRRAPATTRR